MAPLFVCKLCRDKGVRCGKDDQWKMTQHLQSDLHSLTWPEIEKGWKNLVDSSDGPDFEMKQGMIIKPAEPRYIKVCIQVPLRHPQADVEDLLEAARALVKGGVWICDKDSTAVPLSVPSDEVHMAKGNGVWLVPVEPEQAPWRASSSASARVKPY